MNASALDVVGNRVTVAEAGVQGSAGEEAAERRHHVGGTTADLHIRRGSFKGDTGYQPIESPNMDEKAFVFFRQGGVLNEHGQKQKILQIYLNTRWFRQNKWGGGGGLGHDIGAKRDCSRRTSPWRMGVVRIHLWYPRGSQKQ